MTIHTCSRCGYTTNRKQHLKLHLLKKRHVRQKSMRRVYMIY